MSMIEKNKKIENQFPSKKRKTCNLIPYARNSRIHSDEQINQICASIKEFGFTNPIIIDESDMIIAGHGRVMAANKLGVDEVPCVQISGWSEAQKKAYVIADNKLALNAVWDEEMLAIEFEELEELEFDLELTGFDLDEINTLRPNIVEGLTDEDEVPELPENPVSVVGDIWLLGDHRLMCGDSTDAGTAALLMNGEKADMVFTDPPYNTGMTAVSQSSVDGNILWKGTKRAKSGKVRLSHMFDDKYSDEEWQKFMSDFCARYDETTKNNAFLFVCLDWRRSHELIPHLKKYWKFSNLIIWDKLVHGLGSDYKYTHEFIHVCKKGKPPLASNKEGEKEYQDVWRIQRKMGRDEEHATKKPIELCERGIRHGSKYKDTVLDLFGGSGSTLIACEKNNRKCYMMELDSKYVDVIIKRWQDFTGEKAVHENNKTYEELSNMRFAA